MPDIDLVRSKNSVAMTWQSTWYHKSCKRNNFNHRTVHLLIPHLMSLGQVWSNFLVFLLVRARTLFSNSQSIIQHKIWNIFWSLSYNSSESLSFINDIGFVYSTFITTKWNCSSSSYNSLIFNNCFLNSCGIITCLIRVSGSQRWTLGATTCLIRFCWGKAFSMNCFKATGSIFRTDHSSTDWSECI